MYRMFDVFACACLFVALGFASYAKPYQPQVKGGFRHCLSMEYRAPEGKPMSKIGQKRDSVVLDEHGNQIELISFTEGKPAQSNKVANKYNPKGQLSEATYYSKDGKAVVSYIFTYDANANLISDETKNSDGKTTAKAYYKYDKNNFLIQTDYIVIENDKEVLTNSDIYQNDSNGNMIVQTNVQPNGSKMDVTYQYKYDSCKNISKLIRTSFDNYKFVKEFKYDSHGNIIEELYPDDKGKIILRVEYRYTE